MVSSACWGAVRVTVLRVVRVSDWWPTCWYVSTQAIEPSMACGALLHVHLQHLRSVRLCDDTRASLEVPSQVACLGELCVVYWACWPCHCAVGQVVEPTKVSAADGCAPLRTAPPLCSNHANYKGCEPRFRVFDVFPSSPVTAVAGPDTQY